MGNRAHATLCYGVALPEGWFEKLPDGFFDRHHLPASEDDDDLREPGPADALRALFGLPAETPDNVGVCYTGADNEVGTCLLVWHPSLHDTDWDDARRIDPTKLVDPPTAVTSRILGYQSNLGLDLAFPHWILVASYR